ncbi:transcriptional regulator ATRX [Caerostris extrusa]|uniref:Transcriptional regulator ATRX n=1 Tax=Caerostris extrusa TaxID=172846 RepID=A0AAV4W3T6_CAEEX|nr:transcriptional regulator ATRX [Caerostris extrusa]
MFQYPNASIQELRRHLQLLVNQLRIAFQQKHVRILRMKQDFMAKGSVPIALNKYLDDLNIILKDLARHYEGINTLVANDNKEAMLQNMKKYAATYAQQQQFAKANQAFMPNMYQGNMPHRAQSSHANLGFRAQYPTQMNVGPGLNYKQMNSQWNAHAQAYMKNAYPRFTYSSAKPVNKESNKNTAPTSQPVITEVDRNTPSVSNQQQNSHSTVIIEEIE